ncbi:tetratricopeptide repeat protein [Nocardia sp. JMUB6875]|uniref:tetratricopeptide repeat protein n=1 Tax=Nocardia sp. JMUB6875 TaxID=3158170 RepID=UPI0032E71568
MSVTPLRKRLDPVLVVLLLIALAAAVLGVNSLRHGRAEPSAATEPLAAQIEQKRQQLDRVPGNASGWAGLGASYVELARITGDPANYGEAQRALDRSLQLKPEGNAEALSGLGVLANARHDFANARRYAEQALTLRPDSAEIEGVLVDALTQLGDTDAATAAVQRMLDLRPGVPSFTRAAYDLELHGRTAEARDAMQLALAAATTVDQIAFCRYHLGELAFNAGQLDEAETHYRTGLLASPNNAALLQGQAKISAARGDLDRAIAQYAALTARSSLPEYLIEYGELLDAAGHPDQARAQYAAVSDRFRALEAQGATVDLDAASLAADHGDPADAVRLAQLEYARRQNIITTDVLAWALHKAGRDGEAVELADRAGTLGWRNASLLYHRGMILAALGRTDEATAALRTALDINPNFSPLHAPRARQALDTLTAH